MSVQITPQASPDFSASQWLKFEGHGAMPDDPPTVAQFVAACAFLTMLTDHFTEVAGPWFAASAQEVRDLHLDYLTWCQTVHTFGGTWAVQRWTSFSLPNLAAISRRRMQAIAEFGGGRREDFPIYRHLHHVILMASQDPVRTYQSPVATVRSVWR